MLVAAITATTTTAAAIVVVDSLTVHYCNYQYCSMLYPLASSVVCLYNDNQRDSSFSALGGQSDSYRYTVLKQTC